MPENTWTHVATSYDGSFLRVYINGLLEGHAAAPNSVCDNNQPLIIDGKPGLQILDVDELELTEPEAFFNGSLDAFRIYGHAFTVTQTQKVMNETSGLALNTIITMPQANGDDSCTGHDHRNWLGTQMAFDTVQLGIRDQRH